LASILLKRFIRLAQGLARLYAPKKCSHGQTDKGEPKLDVVHGGEVAGRRRRGGGAADAESSVAGSDARLKEDEKLVLVSSLAPPTLKKASLEFKNFR
jgi:hypothetical protein